MESSIKIKYYLCYGDKLKLPKKTQHSLKLNLSETISKAYLTNIKVV